MVKLKIGTGTSANKPKPKEKKEDDYLGDMSDSELEALQTEVNEDGQNGEIEEIIQKEVDETVEVEIDKLISEDEEEDEIEEAIKGVNILTEVGINIRYAEKYLSLFPKKKVLYRKYFTKAFLKWYITNIKISKLKDLYVIESEYVKPEQKDEVMKWITKRMKAPVELEDIGTLGTPKLVGESTELDTREDVEMYEFLLSEKWDVNKRAKGITELDKILEEQMRLKECNMTQALKNIINKFGIASKFGIEKKLIKKDIEQAEFIEQHEAIFSGEPNKGSNAEKIRELDRSVKRFHHIKFLYELMGSEKMKLVGDLSDEEFMHIQAIDHLLNDRTEVKRVEKATKTAKSYKPFADFSGVDQN